MQNQAIVPGVSGGQQNAPLRLLRQEIVKQLGICLTLVRPVSMSDDMASEWMIVAAGAVADMRPTVFAEGCKEALQNCTHHGQIVPAILNCKSAESWKQSGLSPFLPTPPARMAIGNNPATALIEGAAKALRSD